MDLVVLFQSLDMQRNDAEYRYVRLKQDMLEMEHRLDSLEDEMAKMLKEIEHNVGAAVSQTRSRSA